MAYFCLATGLSPVDYKALTLRERQAFVSAYLKRNGVEE